MDDSLGYVPLPINNLDDTNNIESSLIPSPPPKPRRRRLKKFKLKINRNHHNEPLRKKQRLSYTNINNQPAPTQRPKLTVQDPPKPPPKPKGPSKYETVVNLDPSILASIYGTDKAFANAVFNGSDANETLINGDGTEYKIMKEYWCKNKL